MCWPSWIPPRLNSASIRHAPSAFDIQYQLNTNPEMGDVAEAMNATNEDLVATAAYIRTLADLEVNAGIIEELVASLQSARDSSRSWSMVF